jgi:hypothetical protein
MSNDPADQTKCDAMDGCTWYTCMHSAYAPWGCVTENYFDDVIKRNTPVGCDRAAEGPLDGLKKHHQRGESHGHKHNKRHGHHNSEHESQENSEVKGIYGQKEHHRDGHHKKSHCPIGTIIMCLFYFAHMWFLRKMLHWQQEVKDLGGKIEATGCCKWMKKCREEVNKPRQHQVRLPMAQNQNQQVAQVIQEPVSPIMHTTNSYLPEVGPPTVQTRVYHPVASSEVISKGSNNMM